MIPLPHLNFPPSLLTCCCGPLILLHPSYVCKAGADLDAVAALSDEGSGGPRYSALHFAMHHVDPTTASENTRSTLSQRCCTIRIHFMLKHVHLNIFVRKLAHKAISSAAYGRYCKRVLMYMPEAATPPHFTLHVRGCVLRYTVSVVSISYYVFVVLPPSCIRWCVSLRVLP